MEARFASHMPKYITEGTEGTLPFESARRRTATLTDMRVLRFIRMFSKLIYDLVSRPSGIGVSGADGCAVGPGLESRRRHGCLKMYSTFAGYVKSLVYADKPQTLDHLEDNIRRVTADIRPQMLEKVIENWTSRLDYIRASHGSSMPEIIFKIGLVLDFEVLSKYCHNCVVAGRDMGVDSAEFHIWQKGHADECDKNFDGTSGAMEMHAALIMWRRSISDCQMRFVSMLSDGDSKTFQILSDNKIYGSESYCKEARHVVT
ncbi:uncharacterized protein TNCV_4947731 [Trichonephila clavipes]|nr:uncharacterized protein TNCV_4947731 [Trichonephila clavipes]